MNKDKSKLELIGEIAQANNKNLELIEEINKLQNNWNELTKWLIEQEQKAWDEVSSTFGYVLNKMQELQGDDKN